MADEQEYEYDEWGGHKDIKHPDKGYTSFPMLGCGHCQAAFFKVDSRTAHIQTMHPGKSAAPTTDMLHFAQYVPSFAKELGLHSEEHEKAADWVPNDASSLMPNNPNINPKQFGEGH